MKKPMASLDAVRELFLEASCVFPGTMKVDRHRPSGGEAKVGSPQTMKQGQRLHPAQRKLFPQQK